MAESNPFGALHSLTLHGSGWTNTLHERNALGRFGDDTDAT